MGEKRAAEYRSQEPATRREWLETGLALLAEKGASFLRIDALCVRRHGSLSTLRILTDNLDPEIEISVRAWAVGSTDAMDVLCRVDERRIRIVTDLLTSIPAARRRLAAETLYAIHVGCQMLRPKPSRRRILEMYNNAIRAD